MDIDNQNSVVRVFAILEELNKSPLSLTEIAKRTHIHKTTMLRFLSTLCNLGYVLFNEGSKKYAISDKIQEFSQKNSVNNLLNISMTKLIFLSEITQETIHLARLENRLLKYIHKIESTKTLRVVTSSKAGGENPLYCTGLGKAILAFLPEKEKEGFLDSITFIPFTTHTITDRVSLQKELVRIRDFGYSVDNEEHEEGVVCYAMPILNTKGYPIAAISVSGPLFRMKENKETYLGQIRKETRKIEQELYETRDYS